MFIMLGLFLIVGCVWWSYRQGYLPVKDVEKQFMEYVTLFITVSFVFVGSLFAQACEERFTSSWQTACINKGHMIDKKVIKRKNGSIYKTYDACVRMK